MTAKRDLLQLVRAVASPPGTRTEPSAQPSMLLASACAMRRGRLSSSTRLRSGLSISSPTHAPSAVLRLRGPYERAHLARHAAGEGPAIHRLPKRLEEFLGRLGRRMRPRCRAAQ
eukprot:2187672-Prymnesium_polylepis.1